MKRLNASRVGFIAAVLLACTGCNADSSVTTAHSYLKPGDWLSECAGRWILDVPSPIDFGAAATYDEETTVFKEYGSPTLRTYGYDAGRFTISGVYFVESYPLSDDAYGDRFITAFMRGFDSSRRRLTSTPELHGFFGKLDPKYNSKSFAWHGFEHFYAGYVIDLDQRARLFENRIRRDPGALVDLPIEERARRAKGQVHRVVEHLIPRYTPRTPGDIPQSPGICTPYGFFADPPDGTERDYVFDMACRDPRYSNLILRIDIRTRNRYTWSLDDDVDDIRQAETPWDIETRFARQDREDCRAQQGTASRDLLGCTFAGMTNISKQHEVRYLTLANGQEARLLVLEYKPAINEGLAYEVLVEALGTRDSATEPRIVVSGRGYAAITPAEPLHGKHPPPLEEAVELVRTLALSLRLRPGAVDPARPVIDSMEGLR